MNKLHGWGRQKVGSSIKHGSCADTDPVRIESHTSVCWCTYKIDQYQLLLTLSVVFLLTIWGWQRRHTLLANEESPEHAKTTTPDNSKNIFAAGQDSSGDYASRPTIGKVSMLYGANPSPLYARALKSHHIHNQRFNYAMFVLEQDAVGGFWNKPVYLLSLIMAELSKPPAERLQWLMQVLHCSKHFILILAGGSMQT